MKIKAILGIILTLILIYGCNSSSNPEENTKNILLKPDDICQGPDWENPKEIIVENVDFPLDQDEAKIALNKISNQFEWLLEVDSIESASVDADWSSHHICKDDPSYPCGSTIEIYEDKKTYCAHHIG